MTPERLVARASALGLRSLEWCHFPCHEPEKVDWEQVRLLDRLGREKGILNSVAGFAPLLSDGKDRGRMLEMVRTQLEVSRFIGASRMRFHGMTEMQLGIGVRPPLPLCLENLKRVVGEAEKSEIVLALENHMDFTTADFRYFFEQIDSPCLRVNLDTGNLLPLSEDVVAFAREFAGRIVSCHLKGVRYVSRDFGAVLTSCGPEESLVDLASVLSLFAGRAAEVPVHIEVVAMEPADEDRLVGEYAAYLKESPSVEQNPP